MRRSPPSTQAKAAIRAAQLNLDFTRITAPFTAGSAPARSRSAAWSAARTGSGTVLTSIVSLDPIHLDFDMSEADTLAYQRYLASKQPGPGPDGAGPSALSDETGWQPRRTLDFIDNQVDRSSGTLHARATVRTRTC